MKLHHFDAKAQKQMRQNLDGMVQAVRRVYALHHDDQTAVFVAKLTQVTLTEFFREEYEMSKWLNSGLLTVSNAVNEGAAEYGYHEIGRLGEAGIVAEGTTELPQADIKGDYTVHPVHTVATSFRYTTQDIRKAQLQGYWDVASEKAGSAREIFDWEINLLLQNGSKAHNLNGITTLPGMRVLTAVTGSWDTQTGPNILADFVAVFQAETDDTRGRGVINTIAMPSAAWLHISTTPYDTTVPQISILDYLKKAFPSVTMWTEVPSLDTADEAGTGPAAMFYNRRPDRVRGQMPMMLKPLAPQQEGLVFTVGMESRFGGVMAPKPREINRVDGI